jgi:putative hydrolase of the HAD superfamily
MIQAVIFDLGHTVWDYAPTVEARRHMVLRLHAAMEPSLRDSCPPPAELDARLHEIVMRWNERWHNHPYTHQQAPSDMILGELLETLDCSTQSALSHTLTHVVFGTELEMPVIPADSLAAIAELDVRGFRMGCVTNTLALDVGIREVITALGIDRYFKTVVCSSVGGFRKPHVSLFQRALAEIDVRPRDAVFVGDRLVDDIGGAKGAGMYTVLTHQFRQEQSESANCPPDAVIFRLADLPDTIASLEAHLHDATGAAIT